MSKENTLVKKILQFDYNAISLPVLAGYLALGFVYSNFGISAVLGAFLLCLWTGICLLSFIFVKKRKLADTRKIHVFLLIFSIVVVVNILRNFSFNRTVIYYAILLLAGNVLFWIRSPITRKTAKIAKYILVAVSLLFAIVNIIHIYFPSVTEALLSIFTEQSRVYQSGLKKNGYGFAFGMGIGMTAHTIGLGLALVWFSLNKNNWKSHLPMLFVLAFGLFAVQRRGEMLMWLIAIGCTTVVKLIKYHKFNLLRKEQAKRFVLSMLCVVIAFGAFNLSVTNSRFDLDNYLSSNSSSSDVLLDSSEGSGDITDAPEIDFDVEKFSSGRFTLWRLAWEFFLEKPIFGHGWRSFAEIAPESGDPNVADVHNIYLQFLCETGVVGFLLVGTAFGGIFFVLLKKLFKSQDEKECECDLIATCILLAMFGVGMIDLSIFTHYWVQTFQIALFFSFTMRIEKESENNPIQEEKTE